jgi:hypothetical protein
MPLTEGAGQTCEQDEKAAFQQAAQISPKPFVTGWFHNVPSIRTGGFQLCNIFARNDTLRLLVVSDWNCRVRSTMHIAPLLTRCVDMADMRARPHYRQTGLPFLSRGLGRPV